MISRFVSATFYYLFVALVVLNLYQRKGGTDLKRKATLIWAAAVFVLSVVGVLITRSTEFGGARLPDRYMIMSIVLVAIALVLARRHAWPFLLKCPHCGERLGWKAWLTRDSNYCDRCAADLETSGT